MGLQSNPSRDAGRPRPQTGDEATLRELRRQARENGSLRPAEEERLLFESAHGNRISEDRLVAANMAMVIRLATEREERGLSALDLVQEGAIGLVEAVRGFSASGQVSFADFAEQKVGEQMDAALAVEAAAVRDAELLVAAATDYERADLVLRRDLDREPTAGEIAEKLEWTVDRTLYVARVVAEARSRHDEELLAFIDPAAIDFDDDGPAELDA
jgi:DNA-directed RNA polymerase sigma subunit (sigma70/sigma32)